MGDERLRALERRAAAGERADAVALYRERARRGLIAPGEQLRLPVRAHAAAFLPGGRALLHAGALEVWDLEARARVATLGEPRDHDHFLAVVSPDGARVASGVTTGNPSVYAYAGDVFVRALDGGAEAWRTALPGAAWRVAWSPAGDRLAVVCTDKHLRLLDGASGAVLRAWRVPAARGEHAVAWLPDGERLVTGGADRAVRVWEASSGRELLRLTGHDQQVQAVAVSPGGEVAVSGSIDRTLGVWDLRAGRLLARLRGHEKSVDAVALSPVFRRAVSGSKDGTVRVWDLPTGRAVATFGADPGAHGVRWVFTVAVSPDGLQALTCAADDSVRLWTLPA